MRHAGALILTLWLCAGALAQTSLPRTLPPIPLNDQNIAQWRLYLMPAPQDRVWQQIPWRPGLWSAVLEAQRTDRPILLWAMNGHPLGCT
jgi:hypothetical protein